jgi:Protein of unknown function (DUF2934)
MAEQMKKESTAKKPRKVAIEKAATPITLAPKIVQKKTTTRKKAAIAKVTQMVSAEEIARLAHQFWIDRGREHGHDAEDWLRAEQELLGKAS